MQQSVIYPAFAIPVKPQPSGSKIKATFVMNMPGRSRIAVHSNTFEDLMQTLHHLCPSGKLSDLWSLA